MLLIMNHGPPDSKNSRLRTYFCLEETACIGNALKLMADTLLESASKLPNNEWSAMLRRQADLAMTLHYECRGIPKP